MNIFEEVRNLDFPDGQYVVVGSGPMAAHGLKEIQDVDIVVTSELFEKCKQEGWEQVSWTYPERLGQVYLKRGLVELYLDVSCGDFNPTLEELLQRTEYVEGIPFAALADILQFKKAYGRSKHLEDVLEIERYLKKRSDPDTSVKSSKPG